MKKFVVNENSTVFADLTQIVAVLPLGKNVDVVLSGCCGVTLYNGENHDDAVEFAEKLAAEVDAAKESHLENLLKRNSEESAKYACKIINGDATDAADDDEKPITDIYGRTVEPIQISALYINEISAVRAVISDDEIVTLKHFGNTIKNRVYIDELAKRCGFYTVTEFNLYVDPVSVKKVYIDYDDNADYVVFVQIYDFDLPAGTFCDIGEALAKLKQLKKDFNL